MTDAPSWNPLDPDFLSDPYPHYARLRAEDPVHRTPLGPLIVSRYDDAFQVLRDPTTSVRRSRRGSPFRKSLGNRSSMRRWWSTS